MKYKVTASILAKRGRGIDVLASEKFVGPYLGPLEADAIAWARQQDCVVEQAMEETDEPVTLNLEYSKEAA